MYLLDEDEAEELVVDTDVFKRLANKELIELTTKLPDGYRTVLNLYYLEGLPHNEISTLLGISLNTSKSQLHKARKKLKELVEKSNEIHHGKTR